MSIQTVKRGALAAVLGALIPAALVAQQPVAPTDISPEVQEWIAELQELQQELGPVQEQAMQDPQLQEEQMGLQHELETAMRDENPSLFERADDLQQRFESAQEEGDQEALQQLGQEAQSFQMEMAETQQTVLDRPEIQVRLEALQENVRAAMREIDPEVDTKIDRMEQLEQRIQQAMAGQD